MQGVQVSANIHAIEGKVDLVRREIESINGHVNRFKILIDELSKKPDVPVEFESFKTSAEKFIQCTQDQHVSTMSVISDIKSTLQNVKVEIANQDYEIRMLRQSVPALDQKIEATKEELSSKIVSISTAFTNRFDTHADQQKKQLETFSAHAMSAPNSVIESNKKLIEKIELACIDGANALLKASNMELTIKLLERKIENLTLQVKKVELTQQA